MATMNNLMKGVVLLGKVLFSNFYMYMFRLITVIKFNEKECDFYVYLKAGKTRDTETKKTG